MNEFQPMSPDAAARRDDWAARDRGPLLAPRASSDFDGLRNRDEPHDDLSVLRNSLERFEVLGRVETGGQGVVYRARQKGTSRIVAVKVLLDGPLATPRQRYRFEREIELISRLRHPNIVALHESGFVQGRLFYTMDFVDGLSIDEYVILHDLSPRQIVSLMLPVCQAVHYAHQNGVIHRDLKPEHIVVNEAGEPRVVDFGLAKEILDDGASDHSATGLMVGTLPYLSPEQAGGLDAKVDVRSDVYALGLILYQLLTDLFPYPVDGAPAQVRESILTRDPLPLRKAVALGESTRAPQLREINRDLEAILSKALAKPKSERYQSAADLAADLERFLGGKAVAARAGHLWYAIRKTVRRHRVAVGVGAGLAATLAVAGAAVSIAWLEARTQRDAARHSARVATDLLGFAMLELEESVRPLPGGVAVRDRLVARLGEELARLDATASHDPEFRRLAAAYAEKQADLALEQGDHRRAADRLSALCAAVETRAASNPDEWSNAARLHRKRAGAVAWPAEALAASVACAERAAALRPDLEPARRELCLSLLALGTHDNRMCRPAAALAALDRAEHESRSWLDGSELRHRRFLAALRAERGGVLRTLGRGPEGLADVYAALELREQVVATATHDTDARFELMRSYCQVARAEHDRGDTEAAVAFFERAAELGRDLAALDPTSVRWDDTRLVAHREIAALLLDRGCIEAASVHAHAAHTLTQRGLMVLGEGDRALESQASDAMTRGRVLYSRGDISAARDLFAQAVALCETRHRFDPGNLAAQRQLLSACYWIGAASSETRDIQAALHWHERAVEIAVALATADPASLDSALNRVRARLSLVSLLLGPDTTVPDGRATAMLVAARSEFDAIDGSPLSVGREGECESIREALRHSFSLLQLAGAASADR